MRVREKIKICVCVCNNFLNQCNTITCGVELKKHVICRRESLGRPIEGVGWLEGEYEDGVAV
jgi:hypothetical protein